MDQPRRLSTSCFSFLALLSADHLPNRRQVWTKTVPSCHLPALKAVQIVSRLIDQLLKCQLPNQLLPALLPQSYPAHHLHLSRSL